MNGKWVTALGIAVALPVSFTIGTSAQAPTSYTTRCASCHAPSLQGTAHGPELTGPTFMETWSKRSANDLLQFLKTNMPPGEAGSLSDQEYSAGASLARARSRAAPALNARAEAYALNVRAG